MLTPPFDAELLPAYTAMVEGGGGPMTAELLPAIRAEDAAAVPDIQVLTREGRFAVTELAVPGPSGAPDVSLLICEPAGVPGPRPTLYYSFGGGMFSGDHRHRENVDPLLDAAEQIGVTVVAVGRRLAPENPYPAPLDDLYAGLLWAAEHGAEHGIDPERIIVAGTSAGGALTAALTLRVRREGGPRLLGQLLMSPMLDDRNDSPSLRQMDRVDIWDRSWNGFGWSALLGAAAGGRDVPAGAVPARAADLSGLPPAFLDVGSAESLRDEVIAYANRIWAAGGEAELHIWAGGYHCFDKVVPRARISRAACEARNAWIERLLAG